MYAREFQQQSDIYSSQFFQTNICIFFVKSKIFGKLLCKLSENMKKIALFPGSFDPFTKGHHDIVVRATALFDEVVIGIGKNSQKQRYFPLEYMTERITFTYHQHSQVRVESFTGLTAIFAQQIGAKYLLRGLRNTTDFEYENSIAQINKNIYPDLETIFLITSPELAYISSTIVRDIHRYGEQVEKYLPYPLLSV